MVDAAVQGEQLGSGAPLIMLHGWGQTHHNLYALAELLAPYARIHLLTLPGFGETPKPEGDWGSLEYAEWVVRYLDQQGLSKVNLLGHSLGGRISLRIAAVHPERVDRLVLMASHGLKRKRSAVTRARHFAVLKLGRSLKLVDRISGGKLFENWFAPRFGSVDYRRAGALRGTLVKLVNEDQSADLPAIVAPTLLLWGEKDTETPLEMGRRMAALIPKSKLIALPRRGHYPHDDISAHLCAMYIRDSLAEGAV